MYVVDKWLSSALIDMLSFNVFHRVSFLFCHRLGFETLSSAKIGRIVPLTFRFLPGSFHKQHTESICLGGKQDSPSESGIKCH